VIETLAGFRPLTLDETSCAMPRTAPGSSPAEDPDSRTAAVAGVAVWEKSWSSASTRRTCTPLTPWTSLIVLAIEPSSARW